MDSPQTQLATQAVDSDSDTDSPPYSPEITLTAPLSVPDSPLTGNPDDTSTLQNTLQDDTQVLEDVDCGGGDTQALDDSDYDFDELGTTQVLDSEDEGTQLLDDDDGGGSKGGCGDRTELLDVDETQILVNDSDDGSEGTELVDFDETQVLEHLNGGSESLHTSGLAGACKINAEGIDLEAGYIQGNSQIETEVTLRDSGMCGFRGLATNGMQGGERVSNDCMQNFNGVTGRRDGIKCRVARPTVRRLFPEDSPDNGTSLPEVGTDTQESGRLSYVLSQPSQEPGELFKALNTVDKYISINKEDSPQERNLGSARKPKSPLVSSAKGTKMLAFRLRNTLGEADIFDWDDNLEDEGGGYFFSKRKEELLGGGFHAHGSYTQPKNQRPRNPKKGRGTMDRVHSDSRLVVDKLNRDEKKQHLTKSRARKNLSKGLNATRNLGTSSGELKETDTLNNCDVGINKMASEAMETLNLEGTYNDKNVVYQNTPSDTNGCTGDEKKKANSKRAFRCRSSALGGTLRRSGRINKLDTSLSTETSRKISAEENVTGFASGSKTKGKGRKMNAAKNLVCGLAAIGNTVTNGKSSKSTKVVNSGSAVIKTEVKEADRFYRSSMSNGNILARKEHIQEDCRPVASVLPRTRKSFAVNPSKISRLCSGTADGTGEMEAGGRKERQRGPVCDDPNREGQRHKLLSDLISSVTKDKPIQQEPSNSISHEEIAKACNVTKDKLIPQEPSNSISHDRAKTDHVTKDRPIQQEPSDHISCEEIAKTSYEKKGICRYPLRKRTHQNMANDVNGFSNVDIKSTGQAIESNEQSPRMHKKLKTDARKTSVKIDQKRITRSSGRPSSVSLDEKCDGNLTRKSVLNPALNETSINCSSPFVTAKPVLNDKDTLSTYSGKECSEGCVSSIEGGDTKGRSDMSPVGRVKQPFTTCFTPISNCTTPINVASPVITSDNHTNGSGKNNPSRSLMRVLNKLDANDVRQSPASKDLRRKKDMANVRALFSRHLGEDLIRQQKKILLRLGASVACSPAEATHFVTDNFVRTRNMLESIASGKPIVTRSWLESCRQASCFIDEKNYIMRDFKKEKEIGFSMPVSLARATESPLLEDKRVYITENVNPSKELIACLVKAVGGQVVERLGRSSIKDKFPDDLLVISCEEDYAVCVPLIEKGAVIYSSDLLLNGIVIQKLEYKRHCLFADHVKKTRSTTWLRRVDGDQFVPVAKQK